MDTLRQGIAARQAGREILCQGLDRAHFQGEPAIGDGRGEAAGLLEQVGSAGYDGRCFVFDERVALDPELTPLVDA